MSFTLTTLSSAITSYLQEFETTFVSTYVPQSIVQAEDRISKAVILPVNRVYATLTFVNGTPTVAAPTGFLAPFSLHSIVASVYEPVDIVDVSYIRTAYPVIATTGTPKVYSIYDSTTLIVGPTPGAAMTGSMGYFKKPDSLTAGIGSGTTWLSVNAPNCLLYGALSEAYTYLKGEAELQELYEKKFQLALGDLKVLGESMDLGDAYRMGERRVRA